MGIPLRAGRTFTENDSAQAPLVSIVDERAARTIWPGQSAVGKRYRIALPGQQQAWGEVVGVVVSIRHREMNSEDYGNSSISPSRTAGRARARSREMGARRRARCQAIRSLVRASVSTSERGRGRTSGDSTG